MSEKNEELWRIIWSVTLNDFTYRSYLQIVTLSLLIIWLLYVCVVYFVVGESECMISPAAEEWSSVTRTIFVFTRCLQTEAHASERSVGEESFLSFDFGGQDRKNSRMKSIAHVRWGEPRFCASHGELFSDVAVGVCWRCCLCVMIKDTYINQNIYIFDH